MFAASSRSRTRIEHSAIPGLAGDLPPKRPQLPFRLVAVRIAGLHDQQFTRVSDGCDEPLGRRLSGQAAPPSTMAPSTPRVRKASRGTPSKRSWRWRLGGGQRERQEKLQSAPLNADKDLLPRRLAA